MKISFHQPWQDARNAQIVVLSLLLCLGLSGRGWAFSWWHAGLIFFTCLLAQGLLTLNFFNTGQKALAVDWARFSASLWPRQSWKSAVITSLGLCLLLRANQPITLILAASVAIASKFGFQWQQKHWFNPANVGIIAALLLTRDAWVSPGQWGTSACLAAVCLGAGGLVLGQVGRWDTSVVFLGVYATLDLARNFWLGWPAVVTLHHLQNGSLLIFALFMLTDPRSIPNARWGRICWAAAIALVAWGLQVFAYCATGVFWALFFLSPLTLLLDKIFPDTEFHWSVNPQVE